MRYEVNLTVNEINNKGEQQKAKKLYLIDALTLIEAVTKASVYAAEYFSEYECTSAKQVNYAEVITANDADERYYLVKANFITIDERTAAEKRVKNNFIFQADDINDAKRRIEDEIKKWITDIEICSISETKIQTYML
jgi:hypothetical protein